MDKTEFRALRKRLSRTQKQMAQLLGVSLKAVHSYEQGWRTVPPAVERHLFFLVSLAHVVVPATLCWDVRGCPPERRAECPASRFGRGDMCWLINGTLCNGSDQGSWESKMNTCRNCPVFRSRVPL
jgi:DNA-binding XRE family transcriptional regulator